MPNTIDWCSYITAFGTSGLSGWTALAPWELAAKAPEIVRSLLGKLPAAGYTVTDEIAIHESSIVETGATLKGPLIIGPGCFVAAGAYLRGGNWISEDCSVGPGCELKSSFLFPGAKLAHFNFVGDSVIGAHVNMEAGSIVCNYRNERVDKEILVRLPAGLARSGVHKFGALIGDSSRIGANAVLAPGALLSRGTVVARCCLLDQELDA